MNTYLENVYTTLKYFFLKWKTDANCLFVCMPFHFSYFSYSTWVNSTLGGRNKKGGKTLLKSAIPFKLHPLQSRRSRFVFEGKRKRESEGNRRWVRYLLIHVLLLLVWYKPFQHGFPMQRGYFSSLLIFYYFISILVELNRCSESEESPLTTHFHYIGDFASCICMRDSVCLFIIVSDCIKV